MPWIDKEICTGCGACVDECPVGTIHIIEDTAEIDMEGCIRCGKCHEICPEDAVRHDREKTHQRIESNIDEAKKMMSECEKYLQDQEEGKKCLKRILKHYNNEKLIAEKTIDRLKSLQAVSDV